MLQAGYRRQPFVSGRSVRTPLSRAAALLHRASRNTFVVIGMVPSERVR